MKFLKLDCELVLTCSSGAHGEMFTGHIFEILDYYFILKNHFKLKVILPFDFIPRIFSKILKRYKTPINIDDFIFSKFDYLTAPKILVTDDSFIYSHKFISKSIFSFCCCFNYFQPEKQPKNIIYLGDKRIYKNNVIDYVKKVYPEIQQKLDDTHRMNGREFAHISGNTRKLSENTLKELIQKYPNILCYSTELQENYNITNTGLLNFEFSKYIYTPISRHFDCSPRLPVEAKILGIPVEYFKIDYHDIGLEIRRNGIENNINDFILTENDEIIKILKNY